MIHPPIEIITILMFGFVVFPPGAGLACGPSPAVPVGVFFFTVLLQGPAALNLVSTRIFGLMVQYLLAAIPLFIFMACILERSGIIEDVYETVCINGWPGSKAESPLRPFSPAP